MQNNAKELQLYMHGHMAWPFRSGKCTIALYSYQDSQLSNCARWLLWGQNFPF
jgi:hypothetical protein